MNTQSALKPTFGSMPPAHVHFQPEACPACGQEIPPDKLQEISGKIAAREREQALAISGQLEEKYALEKAQAEAKARGDLESERQQSAAREARASAEAQKAAEDLVTEKLAEANRAHQEQMTVWRQQAEDAEAARKAAEQLRSNLQTELAEVRQTNADALEAIKVEAKEREAGIRDEAKRTAEAAATERIAAIEAGQKQSEADLLAKLDKAEADRLVAEQKESALTTQLDHLREANNAEVTKIREEAAADAARIRQEATETAQARFQDTITEHEKAVKDANDKAREAEGKLLSLAEEHALAMDEKLNTQREILEKAKDDAVNGERAKAFDENQKLSNKVNELQRALEKKSADELGEGAEVDVYDALKAEFPDDKITRIAKGASGADIRQVVMLSGTKCGTILYDSKNHKQFRTDHVSKLRTDQLAEKADHAVLSTHKFPQGTGQIHVQDGVLLANPARVVSIATILRQHMLQIHTLRLSRIERESKTAALYEFITSAHCKDLLNRIDERASDLLEQQAKEIKWHQNNWNKQGEALRAIQKVKADLENKIGSIIGTFDDDNAIEEAS